MNTISKTIRLFLDSIGRRSEYEFYLKKFQADRSPCFALVVPDSGSVKDSGDLISFDLHFLLRLELCPLVVLCGEDAEANAQVMAGHGAIQRLNSGSLNDSDEALATCFKECIREVKIPILVLPEMSLKDVVPTLAPRFSTRLHLLRASGMLHDDKGEFLFYLYLRKNFTQQLSSDDQHIASTASLWLDHEPQLHISVSSPLYVLQEMFTVKGRGSVIRPGSDITHTTEIQSVNRERLIDLIENSFGKNLSNPACLDNACDVFVEKNYRGAVVLEEHPSGKYLSKFAVGTQARGEGVAQELWDLACAPQEKLFWRSRSNNPINHWYERHASGHHMEGDWTIFWRGVSSEDLPSIIKVAVNRPADFEENILKKESIKG